MDSKGTCLSHQTKPFVWNLHQFLGNGSLTNLIPRIYIHSGFLSDVYRTPCCGASCVRHTGQSTHWTPPQYKDGLSRYVIYIIKMRQSSDCLIYIMGMRACVSFAVSDDVFRSVLCKKNRNHWLSKQNCWTHCGEKSYFDDWKNSLTHFFRPNVLIVKWSKYKASGVDIISNILFIHDVVILFYD